MRSNAALSYIMALTIVGFFLWLLRCFVQWMQQKNEPPELAVLPAQAESAGSDDKIAVNWPVHVFLRHDDDLPLPGRFTHINPAGAFLQSSADLKTGQIVTLYIDVPGYEQVRVSARVLWARTSRDGRNGAQVRFEDLSADTRAHLFRVAGERPLLMVGEGEPD